MISHSEVLLANFCVSRDLGSWSATDMTVGDREDWTSSNRAPEGRLASRICCERDSGLLLYLHPVSRRGLWAPPPPT
jgi:hypothetical protein